MQISNRIKALTTSPIRKLTPYALQAKAAGKKIYHLNIGQPDIRTPELFMEAVRAFREPVISYGNSQGEDYMVNAVARYYAEWDMAYPAEGIFITSGGSEAIGIALLCVCDPGDEVMLFEPFYANYSSFAKTYNINVNAVPTHAEQGYTMPTEEEIEAAMNPRTRAIIITNPGNPTGTVMTTEEMEIISRVVRRHNLALIVDEVYREFAYDGEFHSFGTMHELDDHLIMVDSVSKRFSACGARIGCILTRNKKLPGEITKICQARLCCPTLEQLGAAALYSTPASYLQRVNKEYRHRRDTIKAALAKLPNVTCSNPQGAFYVMVKLPVDDAEKFAIWLLTEFDIDGETVMFAPGNGFYNDPAKGVDEARLAYVLRSEDLERAIYILGEALKVYPGRRI